jgi:hypothetical protein
MQPPLVQRRSSDAEPSLAFNLESYDARSSSIAHPSPARSLRFETFIVERLNVRERNCPRRSKRDKTVTSDK